MTNNLPYRLTLKEYPLELQPRERLYQLGVQALSDRELLALLLTTGTKGITALEVAENILTENQGFKGLASLSLEELASFPGVGPAKAAKILATFEIGKRVSLRGGELRPIIQSPEDVSNLVMEDMRHYDREHFKTLLLNTKNQVINIETISIGNLNSSLVHPRELFKSAIKRSAAAIILVHNHPSGDPRPSREDINITKRIIEAGNILGIEVLDHIIIGDKVFCSLKEKDLI
ncbi:MAG: DNA repair protein RadC [Clostridia bacterium]|jgi:DNA repair protein RadC|nr:DNA repair protein RadC [Clostridia bacterium]